MTKFNSCVLGILLQRDEGRVRLSDYTPYANGAVTTDDGDAKG